MDSVNLNGYEFDFDLKFFIVKNSGRREPAQILNIDTGPVAYLHIEEDLFNPGINGYFAVKNQAQFLERLGAITTPGETVYIDVNIIDKSASSEAAVTDKVMSFLAILESSSSIGSSIVNNNVVFKFEEATTSMLKKVSMKNLFPTWAKQEGLHVGRYIDSVLRTWVQSALEGAAFGDVVDTTRWNVDSGEPGNIQAFWWDVEDSAYDVLYRLSESIQIVKGNKIRVPILKIKNTRDDSHSTGMSRKLTFEEVFTDRHHEFLKTVRSGKGGNFSDVYMEDFTVVPETPLGPNSGPGLNSVERFDVLTVDIENARASFWGDYMMNNSSTDITITDITLLPFEEIVNSFELSDLNYPEVGLPGSIPVLQPQERKIYKVDRLEQVDPGDGSSVIQDFVYNKCKRSFLFLNDTCLFTVPGLLGRQPGNFIRVKGGSISGDDSSGHNIWLITSVKHIFTELKYETEIAGVRLFGNPKLYKQLIAPDRVHTKVAQLREGITSRNEAAAAAYDEQSASTNLQPIGDVKQTGAVDRSRINNELKDPEVQRLLFASTQAEVGGQGELAQQAYIESVTNRALATNSSLESVLRSPGYYPRSTKRKLNNRNPTDYSTQLNRVLAGSNITNYATDNASGGLANRRLAADNPGTRIGGELFYTNVNGSGRGGVPAHKRWRKGQIRNTRPTTT